MGTHGVGTEVWPAFRFQGQTWALGDPDEVQDGDCLPLSLPTRGAGQQPVGGNGL